MTVTKLFFFFAKVNIDNVFHAPMGYHTLAIFNENIFVFPMYT